MHEVAHVPTDAVLAATEEALTASYRTVFDALDEAFCVIEMIVDAAGTAVDYRFVEVNRAFEDHTGLGEVLGSTVREVLPQIEPFWIETYGQVARTGEPARFVEEIQLLRRWFKVYAWPFGRPERMRVAVHFTDISERKLAEDEFAHRSKQFRTLVQKAPIGVYLLDADFRIVDVNPAACTLFGDVPDLLGRDYEETLRGVWQQDRAAEMVAAARRTMATGVSYDEPELAVVHADPRVTEYYDWRMDRIRLPDGRDGLVCYFGDVSEQVRARHELSISEHRYRSLFESIDAGFCVLEAIADDHEWPIDFRCVEVNPAFARHSGLDDPRGRTVAELVPDLEPVWFDAFGAVALTGEPTRFVAYADALGRWFDVYAFRTEEHDERRVAVLFSDVTDRKRAELELQENVAILRHLTHHDALTGLPNRLLFEEKLREAIASADRHGRPFAVLFLALDGFDSLSADLGHASGDAILIEVARRLRRALRASDMVARLHGDEFVFILPEMSEPHEAGSLAQKLVALVRGPVDVAGTTVHVRASIGVGFYPNDGADPRAVLRAADDAMYQAKLGGRDAAGYVVAPIDAAARTGGPA